MIYDWNSVPDYPKTEEEMKEWRRQYLIRLEEIIHTQKSYEEKISKDNSIEN